MEKLLQDLVLVLLNTLTSFDTLSIDNTNYDQNRELEDSADDIIDWTENNPFGEYGNFTGSI